MAKTLKKKKVPTHFKRKSDDGSGWKCICNSSKEGHRFTRIKAEVDCPECKKILKNE